VVIGEIVKLRDHLMGAALSAKEPE
jgi:hypothetical protein